MIRSASQIGSIFWTKVGVVQAFSIYPSLVDRLSLPAVVVGAIFLATGLPPRERVPGPGLKAHEVAAVLAFVSLPLLAYGLARAVTGALAPRYVLATVVGLAIAFAFASRGVFGDAILRRSWSSSRLVLPRRAANWRSPTSRDICAPNSMRNTCRESSSAAPGPSS